jgi:hypothetical protein
MEVLLMNELLRIEMLAAIEKIERNEVDRKLVKLMASIRAHSLEVEKIVKATLKAEKVEA